MARFLQRPDGPTASRRPSSHRLTRRVCESRRRAKRAPTFRNKGLWLFSWRQLTRPILLWKWALSSLRAQMTHCDVWPSRYWVGASLRLASTRLHKRKRYHLKRRQPSNRTSVYHFPHIILARRMTDLALASESETLENTCRLMYAVLSYLVAKLDFNGNRLRTKQQQQPNN